MHRTNSHSVTSVNLSSPKLKDEEDTLVKQSDTATAGFSERYKQQLLNFFFFFPPHHLIPCENSITLFSLLFNPALLLFA
jgi:hypothetical protein